jgi:YggT family protein
MNGYLTQPLIFLVNTVGSLYLLAVMLRFLLQWARADFFNPISQFLVQITQPLLRPMRRFIPGIAGIDVSSLVLAIALQAVLIALLSLIAYQTIDPTFIVLRTPIELLGLLFNIYIFGIVIMAVLSWVNPHQHNPLQTILLALTEPVIRPLRQVIPPVGGVDLSPMAAIVLLYVLKMLVMRPLNHAVAPII